MVADPFEHAQRIVQALSILRDEPSAERTYRRFVTDSVPRLARALSELHTARHTQWSGLTGWPARDFAGDVVDEFDSIASEGHVIEDPHLGMIRDHSELWLARARDESQTAGTLRP